MGDFCETCGGCRTHGCEGECDLRRCKCIGAWQGPMWNDCGGCNYTRRTGERLYCAPHFGQLIERLTTLATNLAIAAALCRAFNLGGAYHVERYMADWNGGGWTYPFSPGCGREAPR